MLRRLLLLPLLIIVFAFANAQDYQRMVISMADLNGMVIEAGASTGLKANCLDYTRKIPLQNTSLNHILDGSKGTYIEYLHTGKKVPLVSLLGKTNGVSITGSHMSDLRSQYIEKIQSAIDGTDDGGGHFTLHLINHTGQPIRLISENDIQLGEVKEGSVNTYGGASANDIWMNTSLKRMQDMGYISSDVESQLSGMSTDAKQQWLNDVTSDFETKNHLKVTGDLQNHATKEKFNALYNKMLAEQARVENERMSFIKQHDVSISADDPHDYKKQYQDANGITNDLNWEQFNAKLKSDHDHHLIYKKIEGDDKYTKYIVSSRIPGLLYTPSRDLFENYEATEARLFDERLNHEDFYVVNLLDPKGPENASTFDALNTYFSGRHSNYQLSELVKLEKQLKNKNVKYVWVLGHYDDGYLYVSSGGDASRISVDELYAIGKRLGVEIIPLGCNSSISAGGRAGTIAEVNSVDVLRSLFSSVSGNKNYGSFLQDFVGKGTNRQWFVWQFDEQTGLQKLHVFEKGSAESGSQPGGGPIPGETYSYTHHQLYITFPAFLAPIALLNPNHKNDDKQHGKH